MLLGGVESPIQHVCIGFVGVIFTTLLPTGASRYFITFSGAVVSKHLHIYTHAVLCIMFLLFLNK